MTRGVKRAVVIAMAVLALVGIWIAFANLPVITGCAYYGRCGVPVVEH